MSENSVREIRSDRFKDDTSGHNDDSIDLRGIIVTLRKYKWPIILTTALATAATALIVSSMTPVYRSTATFLFDTSTSTSQFENPLIGVGSTLQDIQTQVEILKSRTLAERIVDTLELEKHWEYNASMPAPEEFSNTGPLAPLKTMVSSYLPEKEDSVVDLQNNETFIRDQTVRRLMNNTSVLPLKKTNLVQVSVDGIDRELSTRIANTIGKEYVDFFADQSNSKNSEARVWLEEKVADLKQKYDSAEQRLLTERQNRGIAGDGSTSTGQTIAMFTSRLVDAKTSLEDARIEWDEVRRIRDAVGSNNVPAANGRSEVSFDVVGAEPEPVAAVSNFQYVDSAYENLTAVDSNGAVQRERQQVQEAERQLEELNNKYGVKHPLVIDATSNLNTAMSNLDRQIGNVVSTVENRFRAASRLVRSIESDINSEKGTAYRETADAAAINEIKLDRDTNKAFYEEALAELRDVQEKDLQKVPLSVSDSAAIPDNPVKPKKTLMVLLGFLLSLFGMSALFFAYESMKETVQGIHDVEKKLGLPVFGIVPVMRGGMFGKKTTPLVPGEFDDKRGAFEEAIRTIRTSATVSDLEQHNQVIMVTSSVPAEGKSTVASNLAYSLSKLENVVLVEADMRRPGLGRAMGIRSHGLSELLEGEAYLEDCLRIDAFGKLDVIPAGRVPETHLELLASPEFSELVDLLKSRYDRVVIDLAPVQAVSDAIVVGKHADSAIYVIKSDSTPLPVVRRGIDRLQEVGINVAGAVISQVDLNKISSYGGDYYYQGYYDYYGYGESKKKKKSISREGNDFAARSRAREDEREASKVRRLKRRDVDVKSDPSMDPSLDEDFRA